MEAGPPSASSQYVNKTSHRHPRAGSYSKVWPGAGVSLSQPVRNAMEPIGTLIREELERQERSVSWFARKLSCDRSNIYRLFQKHSVDTAMLMRISVVLGRDFFAELSRNLPQGDTSDTEGVAK